ncbi:MBG domain-containing protein [Acinetobacter bereziniae]|uniref:MBG domain-containing protein n=1 Tax=Acinetobacter bereziniae TaxID=106648 RepID=UPI00124FCB47|nr:MBG domain-containing protein [Acinetobacter bereziniae]
MNKIYKVIWNKKIGCWQAVSELAKNHSPSQSKVNDQNKIIGIAEKVSALFLFGLALLPLSVHAAISNIELPTGAQISSGSATISQNGHTLNINQSSQTLSTNWNSFNIGQNATVNFNQNNASSVAINHVLDSNASQIMGRLNANGQVFLLNPNGVVFSKTAQVNVGGLVASTLALTDHDIQNGQFTLKGDANSHASIENYGTIQTLKGGTVALIAPNVKNTGSITTPNGTTHLTSASQVTLALQDGSLTQYQVDQGVLKGLVDNGGAIFADNGAVYLTAKAKDSLSKAVVNHSGIIEANRLSQNAKGEIILLGDMQAGMTSVSGVLKAEGKNGQDGGFIETSAADVRIDQTTAVSTRSDSGKTGTWLIDPTDFNINAGNAAQSSSGIGATTLANNLASNNVTLQTSDTGNQKGDINVNANVTWDSANSLTLNAHNDININADITATNSDAKLHLIYGQDTANSSANYYLKNGAKVNLQAGQNFSTKKGTDATINYQVITALGAQGSTTGTDLQGMNGNLSGNYVLGADIDTRSSWWNGYKGFQPIGDLNNPFTGQLDGLGHTIKRLEMNRPTQDYIGLIGYASNAQIRNIGFLGGDSIGRNYVGGIVGHLVGGSLENAYSFDSITGMNYVGGLVGANSGSIDNAYATGPISGERAVGGLVGENNANIKNTYTTGTVSGKSQGVGGLIGINRGNVNNAYATGAVSAPNSVGGLIGTNLSGTVQNSYWNIETTGQNTSAAGQGLSTLQMFQQGNMQGFDFDTTWGNGNNQTTPYLKNLNDNRVFNKDDLPTGTITTTNRPALYSPILTLNQLQGMDKDLAGKYVLGNNIDASETVDWNGGAGFKPVGSYYGLASFNGVLNGLGHTINKLTINLPNEAFVGLIGAGTNLTLKNLGIVDANISARLSSGVLVGYIFIGDNQISNVYTTGTFSGCSSGFCGGIVGVFAGAENKLSNSFSSVNINVNSSQYGYVGGLVGGGGQDRKVTIENSYYSGNINSLADNVGGIIGRLYDDTVLNIDNTYVTGTIKGKSNVGNIVGEGNSTTNINNSFWNQDTTGQSLAIGNSQGSLVNTLGLTTTQLQDLNTFKNAGWDIDDAGGTGKVWRIYAGQTTPFLRSFLTQFDLNTLDATTTYNGKNQTLTDVLGLDGSKIFGGAVGGYRNAGTYEDAYYSTQHGYDLIGANNTASDAVLKINQAKLDISAVTDTRVYDGTKQSTAMVEIIGVQTGDSVTAKQVFASQNAGTHRLDIDDIVIQDGNNGNNYEVVTHAATGTIDKAKATVTANSLNTVYNGKNQTASGFTANGLVNGETESVLSGVTASVTAKDAGSYTNKANGVDKNYDLTFVDGALDIAKAKATVTANSLNTVYNGKDQTATGFTATGLVNGETESVLSGVTSSSVTAKDAGNYIHTASGTDKNYDLTFVDGALDIAKAKATVTANSLNTTYNGQDQTASGFIASGFVNGEDASVLASVISSSVTGKDVGNYVHTASGTDKNYDLTFIDGVLDIAKAKATVTANSLNTTYNGQDQTASGFTANGLVNGETESVLTGVTATVSAKDAGSYANKANGVDKNYDLTFVDGALDIAKAKATVTANSLNTVYNGQDQTASGFTASGLVNGEDASVLTGVTASVTAKDAGSYTNKANGVDKNYDLTFVDGALDIAKAKATVTANSLNTTYNGKNQTASGFTASGLVNGEDASVLASVISSSVTAKDAGSYTNKANGVDKNYDLTFVDGALDIAKAKATVTANSLNTVYNGQDQTAAGFIASGFVSGEDASVLASVISSSVTGKDAGNYVHTASGTDKNYDLIFVDGTLHIAKAKATVTANSLNTTYNGQDQTTSGFTASGLVNGENASVLAGVTSSDVIAKDAGNYVHTASGTDKNYDLTFVDGALDIAKAKATVTANSVSSVYNGQNQTATGFSAIGLVNGEDSSVLTGVTASVTAKDAGSYANKANGVDKNYDLTFVDGALDIAKAKATVTANSLNTTYNGKNQTASGFTASGLVNGEDASVLASVISSSVTAKDAGSYTNKANGVDKNYDLTFVDGALDIAKAKATVMANSLNTTYNGKNQTVSGFSATGLVNGETESVLSGVTASVTAKDTGSYANKANGVDKNYDLTFVDGALDIAKAKATVTANSLNTVYNGQDQTASGFTASGLVNGEDRSVLTGVTASVTAKDAGSYTNKANGVDKNYDLTFVDGALDIAKAKATVTANSLNTTYNGKNQTASGFTVSGLVNGETESVLSGVTSSDVIAKDAGNYVHTASGTDKNYDLTFVDGALDIAKAKATVTANSLNTTYNGKDQTASGFTASGLVNGEDRSVLTGVTASVTAKDAGSYTNKANGVDKNYDLTFVDGALDIAKAKATVTANSLNTTYNGKNQTASGFTANGLVNGENASVLVGVTSSSVTAKNAGNYVHTASGTDKNYDLTFVDGALDIAKAKINQVTGITANNRLYDATTHATLNTSSAKFSGMVEGDKLMVATATGQFSDNKVGKAKQVTIQGISLGGVDAHNYQLVNTNAMTTADIYQLTPTTDLQATQFKRPRYLPETQQGFNKVDLEIYQGGVNTTGIQILAGEH